MISHYRKNVEMPITTMQRRRQIHSIWMDYNCMYILWVHRYRRSYADSRCNAIDSMISSLQHSNQQ